MFSKSSSIYYSDIDLKFYMTDTWIEWFQPDVKSLFLYIVIDCMASSYIVYWLSFIPTLKSKNII